MSDVTFPQALRTRCLVTEAELIAWFAAAEPGTRLAYWRGHLAAAIFRGASNLPEPERQELRRVACRAWALAEAGEAHLVQRRNAANDISYLIEVRPRAKSSPAPLRAFAGRHKRLPPPQNLLRKGHAHG